LFGVQRQKFSLFKPDDHQVEPEKVGYPLAQRGIAETKGGWLSFSVPKGRNAKAQGAALGNIVSQTGPP
jgi:hypothetical protein